MTRKVLENNMTRPMTKCKPLPLLSMFFAMLLLPGLAYSSTSPQKQHNKYPINGRSARRSHIPRTLQSWMIRHKAKPKTRIIPLKSNTANPTGSILTFSKPTKDRVARWFGVDDDPNQTIRCMLRKQFNHDSVGMTNPLLHVDNGDNYNDLQLSVHNENVALAVSTKDAKQNKNNAGWWPPLSFSPSHRKEWRILTYRRRVGTGMKCYERVRDAALDWEFQTKDGKLGLLSVPSAAESQSLQIPEPSPRLSRPFVARGRYTVRPIESEENEGESIAFHRSLGSARRLVSYTASQLLPFLPKIYAVNPVMVVYDLLDQRGHGTTFSSTAYATMKGHLLRGEERVTVALRDDNQAVDVEIVSISKAGDSPKAKGIWPFVGKMQSTFFERQLDFLERIGEAHCTSQEIDTLIVGKCRQPGSQQTNKNPLDGNGISVQIVDLRKRKRKDRVRYCSN